MDRKPERDIDLFFFEYKAYYDENDDYRVHWKIDWFWLAVTAAVIVVLFFR